ncbi:MAG: hypothetical protein J0L77_05605 [Alphaproteobacteria bacterium]|nr:hypothetical protein [Alphaproteobacteria bacterium]
MDIIIEKLFHKDTNENDNKSLPAMCLKAGALLGAIGGVAGSCFILPEQVNSFSSDIRMTLAASLGGMGLIRGFFGDVLDTPVMIAGNYKNTPHSIYRAFFEASTNGLAGALFGYMAPEILSGAIGGVSGASVGFVSGHVADFFRYKKESQNTPEIK